MNTNNKKDLIKLTKQSFNLKRPRSWGLLALAAFILALIISSVMTPVVVDKHFLLKSKAENKPMTILFKDASPISTEYYVKVSGKTYLFPVYSREYTKLVLELEKAKITLPDESTRLSYKEKLKINGFVDLFYWACGIFVLIAIYQYYQDYLQKRQDFVRIDTKVTFNDVAGIDAVKQELQEVVNYFNNSDKLIKMGGKVSNGIMLEGPPGTGKTLMAKAVASEIGGNFISAAGSQFVELYVGMGAKRVRELFEKARNNAPCVVFIDEIDAFAKKRGGMNSHSELDQTVNEFLTQMDGFKDNTGVLFIGATNRIKDLDEAFVRPGRFDRKVRVDLPSLKGRKEILDLYVSKVKTMKDIDTNVIAKMTTYFSGADIANLVNEAIMKAVKDNKEEVTMTEFIYAKDKILLGVERDIKLTEQDKTHTAYHEVGHAMVSHLMGGGEVAQISIIPRSNSLGVMQTADEEKSSYSKDQLFAKIMMLLGGKAAENVMFKHSSTGASNDLERATDLARRIVCEFGMGKNGPINVKWNTSEYQLLSERTKGELDREVFDILKELEERTEALLTTHKAKLMEISKVLLEKENIQGDEFIRMMNKNSQESV